MRLFASVIFALILAGCNGHVQVTDSAGRPIEGADVAPVTLSMTGNAQTTNARGEASVPLDMSVQKTKWVSVSKPGFEPQSVPVPAKWPLKIVLQPGK